MNNDDFKNLQSGDIIQDERTKEHLIIIQEGPGNHLFAAKLINIFDPRFYSKPDGNAFLALLPKHDARPFTAPDDAPIVPATSGHGNFGNEPDARAVTPEPHESVADKIKEKLGAVGEGLGEAIGEAFDQR